jgi:hypothetical protein
MTYGTMRMRQIVKLDLERILTMRLQNLRRLPAVFVILVSLISDALPAAEPAWKAGIAKAKITPEKPVWMAGYGSRDHPAEGLLHDLWVKALALGPGRTPRCDYHQ